MNRVLARFKNSELDEISRKALHRLENNELMELNLVITITRKASSYPKWLDGCKV
jgi:hypothetical protein